MNTIPLPTSPFFCAGEGRYLPGLTDLIVLAAAMVQRAEIEEQLFALRLKQRCFVALAERAPHAVTHNFSEAGSDPGFDIGCRYPAVTPSPDSLSLLPIETSPTRHKLKIFPGAWRDQCATL